MKVLELIPYFYPAGALGGPGFQVFQLTKELVKCGNEVTVCTSDTLGRGNRLEPPLERNLDGVEVKYFRKILFKNFYITPKLISFLKSRLRDFDVIHMHEFRTFQNVSAYLTDQNVPFLLSCRGSYPTYFQKTVLKKVFDILIGNNILESSRKIIASSEIEKGHFPSYLKHKVEIIPNSIDLNEFRNLPEEGTFRKRYRIGRGQLILYLGRIHRTKGIDVLVKSLKSTKNATLVVVGHDDGHLNHLKSLIKKLDLSKRVVFTGYLKGSEKLSALVDCDVLILPSISEHESFGNVVLEAVACGKPVVVSDKCGVSSFVERFNFGEVVDAGDIAGLGTAIKRTLSGAKRCDFRNIGKFSIDKIVNDYIKLYSEVRK